MKRPVLWPACIVAALASLSSGLSFAQSATDCSSVAEDMARLKCYDEQAARQKKKTAPPAAASATPAPAASAPPSAAATPSPARTTPPAQPAAAPSGSSDFGLDANAVRKKQSAATPDATKADERFVARVKAVTTQPHGGYRITLEDGQVWEETQQTGGLPPRVGETVTIKHGALGSYFLSRSAGLALRVKRVN